MQPTDIGGPTDLRMFPMFVSSFVTDFFSAIIGMGVKVGDFFTKVTHNNHNNLLNQL